jgi:hypothetical protein
MKRSRDDVLFWVGIALWSAVIYATWPRALSFGDEVGYVGRAKLLLEGHLRYVANSPGIWLATPQGTVGKYPLLPSLLLAPFLAIAPRASFAVGLLSALLLALTARAILKSWNKSPLWALVVLAHPTIVILTRTDMADMPQAAAVVAGWWALRRGRPLATVGWLMLLVAIKATGAVLALGLVAGEAASSLRALRARDPATWKRLAWGAGGGVAGLVLLLALNLAATGKLWFSYDHSTLGTPPFWYTYLPASGPAHLATLLLDPPLLVAGAWAYWRRRELGPVLLSGGYIALMCLYYFVDVGVDWLESLVLSARLILPAVAFLLIGYAAWLDDLLQRFARRSGREAHPELVAPLVALALVAIPFVVAAGVSRRHDQFQRPMDAVREIASAAADAHGERTLGLTPNACKVGLMHNGPTTLFDPVSNRTAVVFCSQVSASHRAPEPPTSCVIPGYHTLMTREGYYALARDDAGGDAL